MRIPARPQFVTSGGTVSHLHGCGKADDIKRLVRALMFAAAGATMNTAAAVLLPHDIAWSSGDRDVRAGVLAVPLTSSSADHAGGMATIVPQGFGRTHAA